MPGLSSPCTAGCFKNHAGCGVRRSGQTPVFLGPEATTVNDRENFPHSLHAHGLCSWLSLTPVTGPCGCVALPQQVKPYRQSRSHQHLQPRGWLPSRQRHCILAKAQAVSCSSRDERAEPSEARSPALSREHWAPASPAQKRRHSWASVDAGTQPPGDGGTPHSSLPKGRLAPPSSAPAFLPTLLPFTSICSCASQSPASRTRTSGSPSAGGGMQPPALAGIASATKARRALVPGCERG